MRLPDACRETGVCVGELVTVTAKHIPAIVRYVGETHFSEGYWIGVEVPPDAATGLPQGKNDGTVDGVTYFKCEPNYGLFCRLDAVHHPVHDRTLMYKFKDIDADGNSLLSAEDLIKYYRDFQKDVSYLHLKCFEENFGNSPDCVIGCVRRM